MIGGGPGGYVAAIRAAQLGVQTTLIEADNVGGTCLNIGCIPSKALIHAAQEFHKLTHYAGDSALGLSVQSPSLDVKQTVAWKDGIVARLTGGVGALLKKNGVQVVNGWARIIDGKTVEVETLGKAGKAVGTDKPQRFSCEHLLLATGSEPVELPFMPFGGPVISSTQALSPASLPGKMAVVGAGYIGLELGMAYAKLGVEVSIVEAQDRILPAYDAELVKPVQAALKKLGVVLHLSRRVLGLTDAGNGLRIASEQDDETVMPVDQVLVAVGRRPRTAGYGLESLLLDMNGAALRIDDQCHTSLRNVWAIGDEIGRAHV